MSALNWEEVTKAMAEAMHLSAKSLDELAQAMQRAARIVVTDETLYALAQAGQLGWSTRYRWRRDVPRCISLGERRYQRPPRREKRRARKRRGKR
jgi:hypothetical protein